MSVVSEFFEKVAFQNKWGCWLVNIEKDIFTYPPDRYPPYMYDYYKYLPTLDSMVGLHLTAYAENEGSWVIPLVPRYPIIREWNDMCTFLNWVPKYIRVDLPTKKVLDLLPSNSIGYEWIQGRKIYTFKSRKVYTPKKNRRAPYRVCLF